MLTLRVRFAGSEERAHFEGAAVVRLGAADLCAVRGRLVPELQRDGLRVLCGGRVTAEHGT